MSTIIAFVLIVIVTLSLARLADRGSRERFLIGRSRSWKASLVESLCKAEMDGLGIRDIEYARKRASRRMWLNLIIPAVFFTSVAIIFYGIIGLGALMTAAIVALLITCQIAGSSYVYGDFILKALGHLNHSENIENRELIPRTFTLLLSCGLALTGVWTILTSTRLFTAGDLFSLTGYLQVAAGVAIITLCASPPRLMHRYLISQRKVPRFSEETTANEILYLRAFDDDEKKIRTIIGDRGALGLLTGGSRMRFEEFIAAVVQTEGNLVAIGRPNERLPPLGAARTYWSDDEWQTAVRNTAAASKIIIMVSGTTEGLRWEIQQLKEWNLLEKCLFLVPPGSTNDTDKRIDRLHVELQVPRDAIDSFPQVELLGFCISPRGRLVGYVGNGRDDTSYFGAITAFSRTINGDVKIPLHGALARHVGYPVAEEPQ